MPMTKEERAKKNAMIEAIQEEKDEKKDDIAGIIARLESIETFLEQSGYHLESPTIVKDLEQVSNFQQGLIGDLDLDQLRQDAHRQNDRKQIGKNTTNIQGLKSTQDLILKQVNN